MSNSKQVQFSDLPVIDNIASTDKVMIDTIDGIRIIEFQNIKENIESSTVIDKIADQIEELGTLKLSKPLANGEPSDGTSGQYLRSLGDGGTEWVDVESTLKNIKDTTNGGVIEGLVQNNLATGQFSHAEGAYTAANGAFSHAEGMYMTANGRSQHVFGEYNIPDQVSNPDDRGDYIEIVGNGASPQEQSNARTLDWDGNERLAGSITLDADTADEETLTGAQIKALKEPNLKSVTVAGTELTPDSNTLSTDALKASIGTVTKSDTGLVPILPNESTTTKYLRQDGTWAVPPDINTTYTAGTGIAMSGTTINNSGVTGLKGVTDSDYRSGNIALTKDSVGLAAVENKSSSTIREELTYENVVQALGYDPAGVLRYKGVKATISEIEAIQDAVGGDVWFCTDNNTEYAYNGSTWDEITLDMTGVVTYIQNWIREYVGNVIEAD